MTPETKALLEVARVHEGSAAAGRRPAKFEARRPELDLLLQKLTDSAHPRPPKRPRKAMPLKGRSQAQTLGHRAMTMCDRKLTDNGAAP